MGNQVESKVESNLSISIIVPAFNAVHTIEACINSILAQEFDSYELVVVDDGSNDGTSALLDRFAERDCRLRVIHQQNMGRCNARNAGIEIATGDWICFCDADDELCKGALHALHSCAKPGVDLIIGGYTDLPDNYDVADKECVATFEIGRGDVVKGLVQTQDLRIEEGGLAICIEEILLRSVWGKLYRRNRLGKNGVRFREGIRYGEDALFNIDYLSSSEGTVIFTNYPVYHYNRIVGSTTRRCSEADADALLPFFAASCDSISKVSDDSSLDIDSIEADRFVGREVSGMVSRAARYGGGAVDTARMLGSVLSDKNIQRCWQAAPISFAGFKGFRTIQILLVQHGRTVEAMAIQIAYVRFYDMLHKNKKLQYRS